MERNHQRNMLHTSEMLAQPGQDHLPHVFAGHAIWGNSSQFPHHDDSARNHYLHRLPASHHRCISYRTYNNGQDHLHYSNHAVQSNNSQFLHHHVSARNQNFLHCPEYPYSSILSDVGFLDGAASAAASNFHNHHLISSSTSRSCPAPLNYGSSIAVHDHNHLNFINPPFQPPTLNSMERRIEIYSDEGSSFVGYRVNLTSSYESNVNGGSLEICNMGRPQYQEIATHRTLTSDSHPSHINHHWLHQHHPPPSTQAVRENNFNHQPQLPSSSFRHPVNNPLQPDSTNPSWGSIDTGSRNFRPLTHLDQRTAQLYQSDRYPEDGIRYRLRVLHEDGVAVLETFRNFSVSATWLDDDTFYGELFSLEEPVGGHTNTGLPEETIIRHLKTRLHVSSANHLNLNEVPSTDQEPEICVICQDEYDNYETIGTLQCGHNYHADCIKKWLLRQNVCPICKATALTIKS